MAGPVHRPCWVVGHDEAVSLTILDNKGFAQIVKCRFLQSYQEAGASLSMLKCRGMASRAPAVVCWTSFIKVKCSADSLVLLGALTPHPVPGYQILYCNT